MKSNPRKVHEWFQHTEGGMIVPLGNMCTHTAWKGIHNQRYITNWKADEPKIQSDD